jgi:hypothetical protein
MALHNLWAWIPVSQSLVELIRSKCSSGSCAPGHEQMVLLYGECFCYWRLVVYILGAEKVNLDDCASCSREFSHRIKSISMAKFTAGEVQALQAGGNEHARELYFKDWDPVRNPLPDNRQVHITQLKTSEVVLMI